MGFFSFSHFFSNLYTISIILFSVLLVEAYLMIRSAIRLMVKLLFWFNSASSSLSETDQFMAAVAEKCPAVRYKKGSTAAVAECAVCLCDVEEGDEVRELQCRHVYHRKCLDKWLEHSGVTCPLCRRLVLLDEALIEQWQNETEYCGEDDDMGLMFLSFRGGNLSRLIWC
ncbi:probable E3 ubiquitin-protein ligase XERICO [Aristolochia californica]|uniref:probable E3 ubiquitin-protein ligase XERICO n=1 Tax=Aristolochia californica TaxID=171875 RepID=UPI0035DF9073